MRHFQYKSESCAYSGDPVWIRKHGWVPQTSNAYTDYAVELTTTRSFGYAEHDIAEKATELDNRIDFHGPRGWAIVTITTAGWPMTAMRGEHWVDYRAEPILRTYSYGAYQEYPWVSRGLLFMWRELRYGGSALPFEQSYPLIALWPGFAINTVFYAVVLWLLFAGPFVLRRRRRIRRGLCPKCAYDLRGSKDAEKCPECGAAMRGSATVR